MELRLRDLDREAIKRFCADRGLPAYRARQLYAWVFARGARSLDELTDWPKALRAQLKEEGVSIACAELATAQRSVDGTCKLAIRLQDGAIVETVLLRMEEGRYTQCVSSQVGCPMNCAFCFTAKLGFQRNLTQGEILEQVFLARDYLASLEPEAAKNTEQSSAERITNFVYMGMGEPLANIENVSRSIQTLCAQDGLGYSGHRITVSTSGLVPQISQLASLNLGIHLAVSLNGTTDEIRSRLMPVNRRYNLDALIQALHNWPLKAQQRLTIEYVLLAGQNDSDDDAVRLCRLMRGLEVRVNLLPFNSFKGSDFVPPSDERVQRFQQILERHHVLVTVRTRRGSDIDAACGQLGRLAKKEREA